MKKLILSFAVMAFLTLPANAETGQCFNTGDNTDQSILPSDIEKYGIKLSSWASNDQFTLKYKFQSDYYERSSGMHAESAGNCNEAMARFTYAVANETGKKFSWIECWHPYSNNNKNEYPDEDAWQRKIKKLQEQFIGNSLN